MKRSETIFCKGKARIFVSIQRAAIKQRVGSVGFYERCKLACERELMGSPANFNLWGECVAQYVALYKSCARNRASISVSKRRVGRRHSGRKCAFLISSISNPLNFQLSLPLRRVNILFIFRHAMPINVVCCARCHLAFDRMPLDALSTYAYSPFYKGTYVVLTGSGILVKKFLLAL